MDRRLCSDVMEIDFPPDCSGDDYHEGDNGNYGDDDDDDDVDYGYSWLARLFVVLVFFFT